MQTITGITDQIDNANLYTDPFKHLIIENIIPSDMYDKLSANFPEKIKTSWATHADQMDNGKPTRSVLKIVHKSILNFSKLTYSQKQCWKEFISIIKSPTFIKCLADKLQVSESTRNKLDKSNIDVQCIYDNKGFMITPHCDTYSQELVYSKNPKILSCIFYFPENEENEENTGTCIYIPDKEGDIKAHGVYYRNRENTMFNDYPEIFRIVKRAPYKKNLLFSFEPTHNLTWHGVPKINSNVNRRSVQVFYRFSN